MFFSMRNRNRAAATVLPEIRAIAVTLLADQRMACREDAELRGPFWEREVGFVDVGSPTPTGIHRSRAPADTSLFVARVAAGKSLAWLPGRLFCGSATEGLVIVPQTLLVGRDTRFTSLASGWKPPAPPSTHLDRRKYWTAIWRDLADICLCFAAYEMRAESNGWRSSVVRGRLRPRPFEKLAESRSEAWQLLSKWCARPERTLHHTLDETPMRIPFSADDDRRISRRTPNREATVVADANLL
jgi:hypothetical protein